MRMALALAEKGKGFTSPNPMVGAVVVKGNRVVGRGYHKRAGSPHAEVIALKEAGNKAKGATLYVTLEPCVHYGRTPPCVPQIIHAGIKRVVVSMEDPNPLVRGKGIRDLREEGVEVVTGVEEEKARLLNEYYIKYITTRKPFVILKWAMSMDGKIATFTGDSRWISGEKARRFVHELRAEVDAVLVGGGTVKKDDPLLNVRLSRPVRQPWRIIIDPRLEIPLEARIFKEEGGRVIIVCREEEEEEKRRILEGKGVEFITFKGERMEISSLLRILGEREVTSLLVEGGEKVFTSFLEEGEVDKVYVIVSPLLIGGDSAPTPFGGRGFPSIQECMRIRKVEWRKKEEDFIFWGYPER